MSLALLRNPRQNATSVPRPPIPVRRLLPVVLLALARASAFSQGTVTVQLENYATMPQTGVVVNSTDNAVYFARVNFLREEPGGGLNRFFVNDLNGRLYILDQTTRQFATYLDFQRNTAEAAGATGLFPAFTRAQGYANGLVTFQFDPEYRVTGPNFGKFYTVHIEFDTDDGDPRRLPNASAHAGFGNAPGYTSTSVNEAPGTDNASTRQAVLIEWQDTNPADTTFQGTARELMRVEFNGRIHPMGDLLFNPRATNPAHPDWRTLYLAIGDGGAGEQNNPVLHPTPQRLDVLQGKILRVTPDDPDGAGPRRYGIPADNPFLNTPGARPEIWAYGFRNPHRIAWDAATDLLLTCDIGFHTWEEINIVRRGGNYGYGEIEGTFALNLASGIANLPIPANTPAQNHILPVLQYPHSATLGYGDAIAGGFVYRGTRIPQLVGKFVFGDITTGHLFHADLEALAAAAANRGPPVGFSRIDVMWENPRGGFAAQRYDRLYEIVAEEYRARGGPRSVLPGSATVSDLTGGGRADIRLAVDAAGELFVLSKSDGMIRAITTPVLPAARPVIARQPAPQSIAVGHTVVFSVEATNAAAYQWRHNGNPIPGATTSILTVTRAAAAQSGAYSVDVSNAVGTTASSTASLVVAPLAEPGRIVNFSIRSNAGTGAQTLIVGLAVETSTGNQPQALLLRGVGPALTSFGVNGALADPQLELFRGSVRLAQNDNWETAGAEVTAFGTRVNAFPLPIGSRDAALVQSSMAPGAYTVQISGATGSGAGATGIALAEVFDATPPGGAARELVNVSARTQVSAGENVLIAGFVIGGNSARTVLIRAAGPVLGTFGVTGTLADPRLALFQGDARIAESDNWETGPELAQAFTAAGAFPFIARSRDAVLLVTLPPGLYTAQVSGLTPAMSGVALVEVYALP